MKQHPGLIIRVLSLLFIIGAFSCQSAATSQNSGLTSGNRFDTRDSSSQAAPLVVYIMPLDTHYGDFEMQRLSAALTQLTASYLNQNRRLQLLNYSRQFKAFPIPYYSSPEKLEKEMLARGVRLLVKGQFVKRDARYQIHLRITDLKQDKNAYPQKIISPPGSLGNAPFEMAMQISKSLIELGLDSEGNNSIASQLQLSLLQRFKPSIDVLRLYARGLDAESRNTSSALQYYIRALQLEPYFREARNRYFLMRYAPAANSRSSQYLAIRAMKNDIASAKLDPIAGAFALSSLAALADQTAYSNTTLAWLNESSRMLKGEGHTQSIQFAENQYSQAQIQFRAGKYTLARSYFKTTQRILDALQMQSSFFYLHNLMEMASAHAHLKQGEQALQCYRQAEKLAQYLQPDKSLQAVLIYNQGVMLHTQGDYKQAMQRFELVRKILAESGLSNSRLQLRTLLNTNAALVHQKKYDQSLIIADQLAVQARALGLLNASYVYALHNSALALYRSGKKREAQLAYRQALLARSGNRARYAVPSYRPASRPLYRDIISPTQTPVAGHLFQSRLEEKQIASYTGAFQFRHHSQVVRSRTYPGRQDDTNIMLRDLFYGSASRPALQQLRQSIFSSQPDVEGRGVLFIDVGPALANSKWPAITSQSIARDFRQMAVVALDLPEQVKLYDRNVPLKLRQSFQSHPNIHILGADGAESLKKAFGERSRWHLKDRTPPGLKGQLIVIRIANSIDIYFAWPRIRKVLAQMATDLHDQSVLLFFNRSIVLKPAGSTKYKIVGYVSVRGFHHNRNLLDRGGEPPYRLIPGITQDK